MALKPEQEKPASSIVIPPGFEKFLENVLPLVHTSRDLLPSLNSINSPEASELVEHLSVLHSLELTPEGTSRRDLVLMEDIAGKMAVVVVCRDMNPPQNRDPAYGELAVIGGLGIYDTPEGESPLAYALAHTKLLSVIMRRKTWMAGLDLGGMKGTIPGEFDWEQSIYLQQAAGFSFSPHGTFTDAITGTDVRQTPDTIAAMAHGSTIGGDHQIAGMIEALDTPGSCRFSFDGTYQALRKIYGRKIPALEGATVLIEGFGRIGRAAARLMLDRGATIILADPLLTGEDELLPSLPDPEGTKQFVSNKLQELTSRYGPDRIQVVKTTEFATQPGQVFCPCAGAEGLLTEEKLRQLAGSGVKVILSGANNPFGTEKIWERAHLASRLGIVIPPEILANCGSVTAAAMEPILRTKMAENPTMTAEKFVAAYVVPHIAQNTQEKLDLLLVVAHQENVDLYTAGEIAFRRAFNLPYEIADNTLQE